MDCSGQLVSLDGGYRSTSNTLTWGILVDDHSIMGDLLWYSVENDGNSMWRLKRRMEGRH